MIQAWAKYAQFICLSLILKVFLLQFRLDQGRTSVSLMLQDVKNTVKRIKDDEMIALSLSLTEKDILCVIAELWTLETYDFFDLALYRSTPCDEITVAQHNEISTAAAQKRGSEFSNTILTCRSKEGEGE